MNVPLFVCGFFVGVGFALAFLVVKIIPRCRHCSVKDQTIGAQAGVAAQMGKEIEHLKGLLDRALVKQDVITKDPKLVLPPAQEDPSIAAEKKQVDRAVASGGEAFGVDE